MPKIQFNEKTGACTVLIPKALCIAKGIKSGTVVDFLIDEKGVIQLVINKL